MKKVYLNIASLTVAGALMLASSQAMAGNHGRRHDEDRGASHAQNIIFMVPDGMGLSNVTATRIFMNGPNGERLSFEKLPTIGYQSTHSANSTVTDSAAAASAWAVGDKFNNGEISCHSEDTVCIDSPTTILELARQAGKATGLVATSTITHATPAAFAAHVNSRQCQAEIARQYIEETGVDVLLGGGFGSNKSSALYNCAQYLGQDPDAVLAQAQAEGYRYVTTAEEMNDVVEDGRTTKLLGLFNAGGLTPEYLRSADISEPRLPEMTRAALAILEEDTDGFFLMVEGSQIDWASHDNNVEYQLGEMIAFNESVEEVLTWINADPSRRHNTLLIVAADHETGGHAINGPYGTLSTQSDLIEPGWTGTNHTATDTMVWSQGPGSGKLGCAMDNTNLFDVMTEALR